MYDKIAVITDGTGGVSTIENGCSVRVYERGDAGWSVTAQVDYAIAFSNSALYRDSLRNLILRLGDCKIVCGSAVTGLAYYVFERMGFSVFEVSNIDEAVLGSIIHELRDDGLFSSKESTYSAEPRETETSGHFFIDLIKLHKFRPEVSSKVALREFIRTAKFRKLEIECSHIPPWIEEQVFTDRRLLCSSSETEPQRFRITIIVR
ncbi:MAG: hypothetical protein LBD85_01460 [Oscillospiraceae bacterium]|jgi:Fe-only nitrogenase accessory protein AnfO|nr:hypothetical protein [Oscillospiraceae bacterium]